MRAYATDQENIDYLNALTSATGKNDVSTSTLYRSVGADVLFGEGGPESAVGKTLTDRGFMSTTKLVPGSEIGFRKITVDTENPVIVEFRVPRGTKGLDVARVDRGLDSEQGQHEVILARNTSYRITGVSTRNGKTWFTADIIGQKEGELWVAEEATARPTARKRRRA